MAHARTWHARGCKTPRRNSGRAESRGRNPLCAMRACSHKHRSHGRMRQAFGFDRVRLEDRAPPKAFDVIIAAEGPADRFAIQIQSKEPPEPEELPHVQCRLLQ